MPQYDFENLCEMFLAVIKGILIANNDGKPEKIVDICNNVQKSIKRLQDKGSLNESQG